MKLISGTRLRAAMIATAAGVAAAVMTAPSPASAAVNDDWSVSTTDGCGVVNFIDYGPGASGGGNNDDYLVIHDYCSDGHGVRAAVWIQGEYWGDRYNGNGLAGAAVVYDPFRDWGGPSNLIGGDHVRVEVCLVDGAGDTTPMRCRTASHTMADG